MTARELLRTGKVSQIRDFFLTSFHIKHTESLGILLDRLERTEDELADVRDQWRKSREEVVALTKSCEGCGHIEGRELDEYPCTQCQRGPEVWQHPDHYDPSEVDKK